MMNDKEFEAAGVRAHVWYWLQLAIWPMIRNTGGCVYCIFLRGVIFGVTTTLLGGTVWMIWK